jgi:hypothetical protein
MDKFEPLTYYEILGVDKGSTDKIIGERAKQMANAFGQASCDTLACRVLLRIVNDVSKILMDKDIRNRYDKMTSEQRVLTGVNMLTVKDKLNKYIKSLQPQQLQQSPPQPQSQPQPPQQLQHDDQRLQELKRRLQLRDEELRLLKKEVEQTQILEQEKIDMIVKEKIKSRQKPKVRKPLSARTPDTWITFVPRQPTKSYTTPSTGTTNVKQSSITSSVKPNNQTQIIKLLIAIKRIHDRIIIIDALIRRSI